jgi:hypothetical protein
MKWTMPTVSHIQMYLEDKFSLSQKEQEFYDAIKEAEVQLMYCEDLCKQLISEKNTLGCV